MPPRKRKHQEAAEPVAEPVPSSPTSERSPPGSDASPTSPVSQPITDLSRNDSEPPRFFNTTFTTYRVSPLYVGKQPLDPARLQLLSKRLRDALVGDVVRGVQVGLDSDTTLGRTGALHAVGWYWVDAEKFLGGADRRDGSIELGNDADERAQGGKQRVMCIDLRYENARFSALLLPYLSEDEDASTSSLQPSWTWQEDGSNNNSRPKEEDRAAFLHFPLLLFRMPAPLKSVLINFLSSTFDCRISPLALGTQTLVSSWEAWLSDRHSRRDGRALTKDVLITLGFHIEPGESTTKGSGNELGDADEQEQGQKPDQPRSGIKTIVVTIPAADAYRFLLAGEKLDDERTASRKRKADARTTLSDEQKNRRRRKLAGGKDEEGWAWRKEYHNATATGGETGESVIEQPFTEALAAYMWHHFGLDIFHPGVRVQRIGCDGFALSEGRLKVFAPARGISSDGEEQESPAWKLVRGLVRRARGTPSWASGAGAKILVQR
ncbi:kinetochore complex Sim4 subunit Fta1-domain-containing protein [Daldinia caldariorum]|uniref:kinetochore complex Sim4 subunit Fta1-domain-containing protein n=1 Tax=Daldinia caldariorum TaxID=326644 RepID=UPI002008B843|nr:kinetochore complex Sim4 subunit Fta1-domain-containing protein [Daldinia caldariorum]KAI1463781.1 kinetochore complex Sim4 subunit Fta1-domain-containing protein [Daldinia caldariorum]